MRKLVPKYSTAPTPSARFVAARPLLEALLIAALLVLVTVGLYCPLTGYDFVSYDDPVFITANPHVQGGLSWAGIKWAFGNTTQAAYWAPLMWLSHMLVWQLFGPNPWGHHLVNVLLHAANTALVFLVLRQMSGATWRSLMVAALFGWHPLRVESVAWVTERKDVLSALFWMLALWAYAKHAECEARNVQSRFKPHPSRFYFLSLLFFACGLLSKPMVVTLPCVMLLLDYWPLERLKRGQVWRLVVEKMPFFALTVAVSILTYVVQKRGGVLAEGADLPVGPRTGNALISYCRYLGKLFWPTDLAVFYPRPEQWPLAEVLVAGGLLLGISTALFVQRRRFPFMLVGWFWFLGTLVPVIGLVQSSDQAMADRFTYLPSLGVLILVVWGAYGITSRRRNRVLALSAGAAAVVLCIVLTRRQLVYWQDTEALFRHAVEVTKGNYIAHCGLGTALLKKGQFEEAISHFREAVRLNPDFADGRYNLAYALAKQGQIDEAISQYRESLRLKPNSADALYNLGNALDKKGQIDQAISEYEEAIRLKPDFAFAHNNLGNALVKKGQIQPAIGQFEEAVRLNADYTLAHINLGDALLKTGQTDQAIREYEEAVRLVPENADAHAELAIALRAGRRDDEAVRQFREALRLKPDQACARSNLDLMLGIRTNSPNR